MLKDWTVDLLEKMVEVSTELSRSGYVCNMTKPVPELDQYNPLSVFRVQKENHNSPNDCLYIMFTSSRDNPGRSFEWRGHIRTFYYSRLNHGLSVEDEYIEGSVVNHLDDLFDALARGEDE